MNKICTPYFVFVEFCCVLRTLARPHFISHAEKILVFFSPNTRHKVDEIVAKPAATSTIDPHLKAMYNEVTWLIGTDKSSGGDINDSNGKTKI